MDELCHGWDRLQVLRNPNLNESANCHRVNCNQVSFTKAIAVEPKKPGNVKHMEMPEPEPLDGSILV